MTRDGLVVLLVLGMSVGSGALWFVRERQHAVPVAPDPAMVAAIEGSGRGAGASVPTPRLDFDDASLAVTEPDAVLYADADLVGAAASASAERVPRRGHDPAITVEDVLALLAEGGREALAELQRNLIAAGNASLPLLEAMLQAGRWQAERMAISVLSQIDTTEALFVGLGHLLTREQPVRRGWHHLAATLGRGMNGDMVDLLAAMSEDAEGESRRRMIMLLQHVRSEDGLFRLYMLGEEHPDPVIRRMALNTVFRGRRYGSMPLLQDIMMTHENAEVAAMAAIGLAEGGWQDALAFLAAAGSGGGTEAEIALHALEHARSTRSQHVLTQIAGGVDYTDDVRLAALRALGNSRRPQRARRYVAQLAAHADSPTVRAAAAALLDAQM